jgi:hypothetical protein
MNWIKCSDQMPLSGRHIWAYCSDSKSIYLAMFQHHDWVVVDLWDGWHSKKNITHWSEIGDLPNEVD